MGGEGRGKGGTVSVKEALRSWEGGGGRKEGGGEREVQYP